MPSKSFSRQALLSFVFLFFAASVGSAAVSFSPNSVLPEDTVFRAKLTEAIEKSCGAPPANTTYVEIESQVRVDRVDQGVVDHYYSSVFGLYGENGSHGEAVLLSEIQVESAWFSGSNPSPYDFIHIESVKGCHSGESVKPE